MQITRRLWLQTLAATTLGGLSGCVTTDNSNNVAVQNAADPEGMEDTSLGNTDEHDAAISSGVYFQIERAADVEGADVEFTFAPYDTETGTLIQRDGQIATLRRTLNASDNADAEGFQTLDLPPGNYLLWKVHSSYSAYPISRGTSQSTHLPNPLPNSGIGGAMLGGAILGVITGLIAVSTSPSGSYKAQFASDDGNRIYKNAVIFTVQNKKVTYIGNFLFRSHPNNYNLGFEYRYSPDLNKSPSPPKSPMSEAILKRPDEDVTTTYLYFSTY